MDSILDKTVSLTLYPDSQNFDMSNAYIYISKILGTYGVPNPSLVSGVVMQFEPIEKNVIQSEKNLIENLARVAEEINNNNALNFLVSLGVSISQDSINALSNSISDSVTQFDSIKTAFERPYVLPGEPQPQPQPQPQPPRICTKDMFRCPDGSLVSRDEFCNFRPCPEPQPILGYGGGEVVVETQPQYEPKVAKLQFITFPTSDPVGDEYRAKLKFVNMYMSTLYEIAGGLEGLGKGFSLGGRGGFQWRSIIALQTPEQEKRLFDLVQQASTDPDFGLKVVVSFLPLSSEPSLM